MSDPTAEKALRDELDQVLRKSIVAGDEVRRIQRELDSVQRIQSELSTKAQRLRVALFALEGKASDGKILGEANAANHERQAELRQGRPT